MSLVQLVAGVSIAHQPCPAYLPDAVSCYSPEEKRIYLAPGAGRFTLAHEYGHAYDFERLTSKDRRRFQVILGFGPDKPWWGRGTGRDDHSPGEVFADVYAYCALGVKDWWVSEFVGQKRAYKVCRLLPPSAYAALRRMPLLGRHA